MRFALIDTHGMFDKRMFLTRENAIDYRKELNRKFNCIGRFRIKTI